MVAVTGGNKASAGFCFRTNDPDLLIGLRTPFCAAVDDKSVPDVGLGSFYVLREKGRDIEK